MQRLPKEYRATFRLGEQSDTADIEGSVTVVADIVAMADTLIVEEDGTSDPINVLSNDTVNVGTISLESPTGSARWPQLPSNAVSGERQVVTSPK